MTVLTANAAVMQRSSTRHSIGESGERGLECTGARAVKGPSLEHLSLVPEGSARALRRGLLGDQAAQRCPRMAHRWAVAHEAHLRCGHTFVANRRERAVKTQRAFDAQRPTFCQASAAGSAVSLRSGARIRRSSRARRGLERRSRPYPPAVLIGDCWNTQNRGVYYTSSPPSAARRLAAGPAYPRARPREPPGYPEGMAMSQVC